MQTIIALLHLPHDVLQPALDVAKDIAGYFVTGVTMLVLIEVLDRRQQAKAWRAVGGK